MGRFTNPRDLYFGEGARHEVKNLKGKKAIIVSGGSGLDDMTGSKAAVEPEGADGLLSGGSKVLVGDFGGINRVAELQETRLHVLDGCSLHARCNRFHERTPFGVPFVLFERLSDRQRKGMHKHALNSVASCA